jgi:hypothetical protein
MGVGYTLIVPRAQAQKALNAWPGAAVVGWVEKRAPGDSAVVVHPARA